MSFALTKRSLNNLAGVTPVLVQTVEWAAAYCPPGWSFVVTEGLRTKARQRLLVDQGLSLTLDSFHITGHAVDLAVIVAGKAIWKFEAYAALNDLMQLGAKHEGVQLTWGGGWARFRDGPHFQTPR